MNKTFQWNGEKFYFSALEAETTRKFIPEATKTAKALEDYEKMLQEQGIFLVQMILLQNAKIIDAFLDTILGEGAVEKMFKGYDLGERVAATQKLTRLNNAQVKEYGEAASKGLFA